MFFVVSSPEVMTEANAVIENHLKAWGIHSCSLLYRVQRLLPRLTPSLRTYKGMDAGLFFIVSSPEVMAEADAVVENLIKGWMQACSFWSRVQRSWPRLTLSLKTL
jgi:hypothetical protein